MTTIKWCDWCEKPVAISDRPLDSFSGRSCVECGRDNALLDATAADLAEYAAEQAGVTFDVTHDGVQIGDCTIEACTDGYRVYRWQRDPSRDGVLIATTPDAAEAVTIAADH